MTPVRIAWFAFGLVTLGLAILGVILPLLPTTPFLLLAAYAFARSSERWHTWLITHKTFGPLIRDWNEHGAIDKRTKIVGVLSMVAVIALSVALEASTRILVVQAIALSASAIFVLTRPLPPKA